MSRQLLARTAFEVAALYLVAAVIPTEGGRDVTVGAVGVAVNEGHEEGAGFADGSTAGIVPLAGHGGEGKITDGKGGELHIVGIRLFTALFLPLLVQTVRKPFTDHADLARFGGAILLQCLTDKVGKLSALSLVVSV